MNKRGRKPAVIPDSIADDCRAGNPINVLTREYHAGALHIRQRLIELGVKIRPRGRQQQKRRHRSREAEA